MDVVPGLHSTCNVNSGDLPTLTLECDLLLSHIPASPGLSQCRETNFESAQLSETNTVFCLIFCCPTDNITKKVDYGGHANCRRRDPRTSERRMMAAFLYIRAPSSMSSQAVNRVFAASCYLGRDAPPSAQQPPLTPHAILKREQWYKLLRGFRGQAHDEMVDSDEEGPHAKAPDARNVDQPFFRSCSTRNLEVIFRSGDQMTFPLRRISAAHYFRTQQHIHPKQYYSSSPSIIRVKLLQLFSTCAGRDINAAMSTQSQSAAPIPSVHECLRACLFLGISYSRRL
ncbi:hypothetical protein EDB92DRAFT_1817827 [Lactarius akahatsu]|uniref:Uncharacterized protein n=1 Tax=Lactarius akahatsu TaxID=416441 RepID=A0AAD4LEA7_9AGAM|nr:hypothetical protein EDB92DRAFT_1817827 [Lactarius akahatsu]